MGICTGRGDAGDTDFRGGRVPKDSPLIEALGGIDELQAFLADAAHSLPEAEAADIRSVVADCSTAMAVLAGFGEGCAFLAEKTDSLGKAISHMEAEFEMKGFVLPGKTPASAKLDICRTVCRRAERAVVAAQRHGFADSGIGMWLNRLSDYLYLLARFSEDRPGTP